MKISYYFNNQYVSKKILSLEKIMKFINNFIIVFDVIFYMIEVIINSKIRFIKNIEIKEEITMFKQKSITDFRVTFRYSSYFHDIDYVNKKYLN